VIAVYVVEVVVALVVYPSHFIASEITTPSVVNSMIYL
jgi:hypothetical protein